MVLRENLNPFLIPFTTNQKKDKHFIAYNHFNFFQTKRNKKNRRSIGSLSSSPSFFVHLTIKANQKNQNFDTKNDGWVILQIVNCTTMP